MHSTVFCGVIERYNNNNTWYTYLPQRENVPSRNRNLRMFPRIELSRSLTENVRSKSSDEDGTTPYDKGQHATIEGVSALSEKAMRVHACFRKIWTTVQMFPMTTVYDIITIRTCSGSTCALSAYPQDFPIVLCTYVIFIVTLAINSTFSLYRSV